MYKRQLQRIRTAGNDANAYASDYRDIGVLKALADKYRIAILLVHHLRKMNDDDPMNMISGTTGLSGATDSNFVLRKSKRRENTATLYCTGRDIPYRELALEFDGEDHVWKLLSDDCEPVSYTHLDVYKRQLLRCHTSCKESATPAEEIPELSAGQAEW